DLSDLNTGTFTITLAGTDDLDFGEASQSTTVTVTGDDDVSLDLDSSRVTRGEDVTFRIRGSNAGDFHVVTIESDEFRSQTQSSTANNSIFRNVGDVVSKGSRLTNGGYAYAVVEIDDDTGVGIGQIDTTNLDDSSVDVNLYAQNSTAPTGSAIDGAAISSRLEDDPSLTVEQGDVEINQPGNTYVVGSEVDLNGTASEGIDDVAFYVRRQGDYQLVDLDGRSDNGITQTSLNVDADNTFEKEDLVLSAGDGDGNDLLSQPGTYRFGVIDTADVGGTGSIDSDVNVSTFNTGTSSQKSLRVTDTELDANIQTIGGQVSTDDRVVNVTGTALGSQTVAFIFIDERGNVHYTDLSVDDDNTFEEEDLNVGSDLVEGQVSAHAMTAGRDDQFGEGLSTSGSDAYSRLQSLASNLDSDSLTGSQARARLLDQTTEAVASDDRMVTQQFRLADSRTTIGSVYPDGMEASGVNP
ncbi:HVO_2072 family ArtA-dependent S-layer glycoprotein, partial [Haloplanus aerogenes]